MSGSPPDKAASGLRWSNWNLLLLVPLLMLITPLFNMDEPRLFGFPFFYWSQLVFVLVGVGSVALVYVKTKDEPDELAVADLSIDGPGEGSSR